MANDAHGKARVTNVYSLDYLPSHRRYTVHVGRGGLHVRHVLWDVDQVAHPNLQACWPGVCQVLGEAPERGEVPPFISPLQLALMLPP
jgi:hypothetical protein